MPAGRPTLYREEYAEQAYKLCLLSATDEEIARFFEVDVRTIFRWKDDHPEFCQAIARGKDVADANVAERLYNRALGYEHDDVHVSNYQGEVTLTPIRKYYPPDTAAASLWLRNRQPAKWRDKQDHEVYGKDGGPIETSVADMRAAARREIDEAFPERARETGENHG